MIINELKYSYNDLTLVPARISRVKSRSECNPFFDGEGRLPIFTAPMASVVSHTNYGEFIAEGITPIIPRNIDLNNRLSLAKEGIWVALSLNEFKEYFIDNADKLPNGKQYNICVDIANGHMKYLYDLCKEGKETAVELGYGLTIMTGNIANPETLRDLADSGCDLIRCAIGSGNGCITSSNTAVHYPIASLIAEARDIRTELESEGKKCPKIIADGGIRNYSDVIKALALGADYVMIGSLFSKCIESCADKFTCLEGNEYVPCKQSRAEEFYNQGLTVFAKFFGMASADGQRSISGKKTKTSEGITKYLKIEYSLPKWADNMKSYLKSAMSYCDCLTLEEFIGKQKLVVNSVHTINSVNK